MSGLPWEEIGWEGYSDWQDEAERAGGEWSQDDTRDDVVAFGPNTPEATRPAHTYRPDLWQPEDKDREYASPRRKRPYKPVAKAPVTLVITRNKLPRKEDAVVHIVPDPVYTPDGWKLCRNSTGPRMKEIDEDDVRAVPYRRFCTLCLSNLRHGERMRRLVIKHLKKMGFGKPANWRRQYGDWARAT